MTVGLIVAVGIATFFAGAYITSLGQQESITQDELDQAIAKLELKILQRNLAENQQMQQQQSQPQQPVRISVDDDPFIGDPDAPITIIEFSDYQCPFCARFSTQTLPTLQEEYIDQGMVKLVYRDFPIQSIHPNALITAVASECADDQGKFKEMHDIIFENQQQWSEYTTEDMIAALNAYASQVRLDGGEFNVCMTNGNHIEEIRGDLEDGRAYGVSGTPGFFIGNDKVGYVMIQGAQPFESFKRVIDAQLGL